jgi:hypothetical protein
VGFGGTGSGEAFGLRPLEDEDTGCDSALPTPTPTSGQGTIVIAAAILLGSLKTVRAGVVFTSSTASDGGFQYPKLLVELQERPLRRSAFCR